MIRAAQPTESETKIRRIMSSVQLHENLYDNSLELCSIRCDGIWIVYPPPVVFTGKWKIELMGMRIQLGTSLNGGTTLNYKDNPKLCHGLTTAKKNKIMLFQDSHPLLSLSSRNDGGASRNEVAAPPSRWPVPTRWLHLRRSGRTTRNCARSPWSHC